MQANQKGGNTLLTTLSLLGILTVLGFVLSQMSVEHLAMTALKSSRQSALDLARSAVSLGLARLSQDPAFGTLDATPTLRVAGERPQDQGLLIFDPQQARRLGLPFSLNNLQGTAAKPGSLGDPVPAGSAQLLGIGQAGGQIRRIEVKVALPPFPFAIASSGPIRAVHGVRIAGVPSLPATPNALATMAFTEADLASNDPTPEAVFLGPDSQVQGSVQAVGQVSLHPSAQVSGSIQSHSDHESLPSQHLSQYDPMLTGEDFSAVETPHLSQGANQLSGRVRRAGSLEVRDGLHLDGCLLYVDGDLKVSGGLKGKGAVVASGNVTLEGQSQFESGNRVAILSGHDTQVTGSGPAGSFFQGLIYTQGRFSADRVTLVGSLIADDEDRRSPVSLTASRLFSAPDPTVRFDLSPGTNPPTQGPLLGSFPFRVFDKESGRRETLQVELRQGEGGIWLQVGPYPVDFVDDPALVLDAIVSHLGAYSYQPLRPILNPLLSGYNPNWRPPGSGGSQPPATVVTIDPSSFLKLEERMRIVLWREDR